MRGDEGRIALLTVLLAVWYIVWPVAGVNCIIVEKGEGTLLDCSSSVPTMPVASARGSVWEDSILPGTVLRGNWLLCCGKDRARQISVRAMVDSSRSMWATYVQ